MSTRDIQAHFEEAYDVEVSSTFISQVTNAVLDEVKIWQQRLLNKVYPIVYLGPEPFKTKPFISHLASTVTVKKSCWAFGCHQNQTFIPERRRRVKTAVSGFKSNCEEADDAT
jgi:hypothetical protein